MLRPAILLVIMTLPAPAWAQGPQRVVIQQNRLEQISDDALVVCRKAAGTTGSSREKALQLSYEFELRRYTSSEKAVAIQMCRVWLNGAKVGSELP